MIVKNPDSDRPGDPAGNVALAAALTRARAEVDLLREALENIEWNSRIHAHTDTGRIARTALAALSGQADGARAAVLEDAPMALPRYELMETAAGRAMVPFEGGAWYLHSDVDPLLARVAAAGAQTAAADMQERIAVFLESHGITHDLETGFTVVPAAEAGDNGMSPGTAYAAAVRNLPLVPEAPEERS